MSFFFFFFFFGQKTTWEGGPFFDGGSDTFEGEMRGACLEQD